MLKTNTNKERVPHKTGTVGRIVLQGFIIVAFEFLIGGALALKNISYANWQNEAGDFRWLVLVRGDLVAVDDVGRFLSSLDGVKETRLLDRAQILSELSEEQLWPDEAAAVGTDSLPQSWMVRWGQNPRSLQDQQALLSDIRKKDGVVDVAFDPHALERIRSWRKMLLTSRFVLGSVSFLLVLAFGWIVGKYLFFSSLKMPRWAETWRILASDFIPWLAGYFLSALIYGWLPPAVLLGGLILGVAHVVWEQSQIQ